MSASASVEEAALNNAEWCNRFCRTHGVNGRFDVDAWTSAARTPPLYPDAVTLAAGASVDEILRRVDTSVGCSIKDSFADLDLAPFGFEALVAAEWLRQDPPARQAASHGWSTVAREDELERWEAVWGNSVELRPFFRRELLVDSRLAVLARYDRERVTAGAIANRSRTVIGLTNVFDLRGDLEAAWTEAASRARVLWGAMPVVGYDSGEALAAAQRARFAATGGLVVWVKRHEP